MDRKYSNFIGNLEYLVDCHESWRAVDDEQRLEIYNLYGETKEGVNLYNGSLKDEGIRESGLDIEFYTLTAKLLSDLDTCESIEVKSELMDVLLQILDPALYLIMEDYFNSEKDSREVEKCDDFHPTFAEDHADRLANYGGF